MMAYNFTEVRALQEKLGEAVIEEIRQDLIERSKNPIKNEDKSTQVMFSDKFKEVTKELFKVRVAPALRYDNIILDMIFSTVGVYKDKWGDLKIDSEKFKNFLESSQIINFDLLENIIEEQLEKSVEKILNNPESLVKLIKEISEEQVTQSVEDFIKHVVREKVSSKMQYSVREKLDSLDLTIDQVITESLEKIAGGN